VGRLVATAQNGLEVLRYGGLETGAVPSPFQVVESVPMYRLRRYFPPDTRPGAKPPGAPVLMVHPMMMSADMWDVTREDGAVGILHARGLDPWVIDFGSPDKVEGGMRRNLADHIVALSQAIDTVHDTTGQDVHIVGYSQGGMFCYQAAAYRRSKNVASVVAFGSPVDTLAALPMGIPANFGAAAASFMADHVFNRLAIPSWMARTGFQMMDPLKTAKARIDFLRDDGGMVDIKTTIDASPEGFGRIIASFLYHVQGAHYWSGGEHVLGASPKFFAFIAAEKEPPYGVSTQVLQVDALRVGMAKADRALKKYAEAVATGRWTAYSDLIEPAQLPGWALRETAMAPSS